MIGCTGDLGDKAAAGPLEPVAAYVGSRDDFCAVMPAHDCHGGDDDVEDGGDPPADEAEAVREDVEALQWKLHLV